MKIYPSNIVVALATLTLTLSSQAAVVFTEDFSDFATGQNIASAERWNAKWTAEQQQLWTGTADQTATLDLSSAWNNFHATYQEGFSLAGSETATTSVDFRFTHNGLGTPSEVNKGFFGLGFAAENEWWEVTNRADARVANRNGAVGMALTVAPWTEGWLSWGSLGVDPNGGVASTSSWLQEEYTISVINGTYHTQGVLLNASGDTIFTGSQVDTGVAESTVIYATMTNGFVATGGTTTTEAFTNISSVEVDNFTVDLSAAAAVPEPSTYAILIGLCSLGFVLIRRKK